MCIISYDITSNKLLKMVKQIKSERVIKSFLKSLQVFDISMGRFIDYYLVNDSDSVVDMITVDTVSKKVFVYIDGFPFYNKLTHSLVVKFLSEYNDYIFMLNDRETPNIKIDDLE